MWGRLGRYGLIGVTGVAVNVAVLTLARRLFPGLPTATYVIAVEASIISNYLLNAWFTFKQPASWPKLLQYNLVSAGGLLIQTGIYRLLLAHPWNQYVATRYVAERHAWWAIILTNPHWNYLIADLVAIPFGTIVGFLLAQFWVFRPVKGGSDGDQDSHPRPERARSHH